MRSRTQALLPGLLRGALLGGVTYAIGDGRGLSALGIGVDVGLWVVTGYTGAVALLASDVARVFFSAPWSRLLVLILRRVGFTAFVFGGLSVMPQVGAGWARALALPIQLQQDLLALLRHGARLAPWSLAYSAVVAAYQVFALTVVERRHLPIPERLSSVPEAPVAHLKRVSLLAALTFFALHDGGLLDRVNGQGLGSLELPLYLAMFLFLLGSWSDLWPRQESGRTAGLLLRGGAWSILAHQVLSGLPATAKVLDNVASLGAGINLLTPYAAHASNLSIWSVLFIAVLTAYRIREPYLLRRLGKDPSAATSRPSGEPGAATQTVRASPERGFAWACGLAAAVYLLFHQRGILNATWGMNLAALQGPLYAALALHLAGTLVGFLGRSPWHQASQRALQGLAWGISAFALLRGIPPVLESLARSQSSASIGSSLGPYLGLFPPLAPWVIGYALLVTGYRATAVYWNHPRFPWIHERLRAQADAPLRLVTWAALVSLAIHLLLAPSGLWRFWTGLDLSFLAAPLYAANGVVFAAGLLRILGNDRRLLALSTFLHWSALAAVVFFSTHQLGRVGAEIATTPPFVDMGERVLPYLATIRALDVWLGAALLLFAAYKASGIYWSQPRYESIRPMVQAGLFFLLAGVVWGAFGSLSAMGPIYPGMGAVASSALVAVAAGYLTHYLSDHPASLVRTLAGWSSASPFRNANVGGFVALYAVFVRPAVYDAFLYGPLLEWSGTAVLCLYVIRRTWTNMAVQPASPAEAPLWPAWIRHRQEVSVIPDLPLQSATHAQEEYLSRDNGAPLVARLVIALDAAGAPPERIAKVTEPLVSCQDPRVPPLQRVATRFLPGGRIRQARRLGQARLGVLQRVAGLLEEAQDLIRYRPASIVIDGEQLWSWAEESFAAGGSGAELATAVTIQGSRGDASSARIVSLVARVLEYQDPAISWLVLRGGRSRLIQERKDRRRHLVRTMREMITLQASTQTPGSNPSNGATI